MNDTHDSHSTGNAVTAVADASVATTAGERRAVDSATRTFVAAHRGLPRRAAAGGARGFVGQGLAVLAATHRGPIMQARIVQDLVGGVGVGDGPGERVLGGAACQFLNPEKRCGVILGAWSQVMIPARPTPKSPSSRQLARRV